MGGPAAELSDPVPGCKGCLHISVSISIEFRRACRFHGCLRGRDGPAACWRMARRTPQRSECAVPYRPQRAGRGVRSLVPAGTTRSPCGEPGVLLAIYAAAFGIAQNSALSANMRCRITASLRAMATLAFLCPIRLARRTPHSFKAEVFWTRDSNVVAASNR